MYVAIVMKIFLNYNHVATLQQDHKQFLPFWYVSYSSIQALGY